MMLLRLRVRSIVSYRSHNEWICAILMWSEICVSGWHKESENPNFHWRQIRILIPKWILYIVLTRLTDARFMTIKDQWIPASRRVRKVDNTEAKRWMPWFWPRARRVGLTRNGLSGERWTRGLREGREMGSPARPLCNNKSPNSSCQDIPLGQ